jgi:hypothetical protein
MNKPAISGWIAVALSTIVSSQWAFWGAFESFHEGWYFESLGENLVLTLKYISLMLIFMLLTALAIRWHRVGGILYELFGIGFFVWILMTRKVLNVWVVASWMPVLLPPLFLGPLFWFGRVRPRRLAYAVALLFPLSVAALFAVEPVFRIAGRVDDGNRGTRIVEGNGVRLVWAPEGPGWPNPDPHDGTWAAEWRGPTWEEARRICLHLTADGKSVAEMPQHIWRLPTVDEAVRSMARHGKNCRGVWNGTFALAFYARKPDKEPPLWNPYSPVIYWWTASERNAGRAYSIDFNGNVYSRSKVSTMGSQAFRAVRDLAMP